MDDVAFTFDPTPFLSGLNRITQQMDQLVQHFRETADKLGGGMEKVQQKNTKLGKQNAMMIDGFGKKMGGAINGLIFKVGALGGAFLGLRSIMNGIPEIGRVFNIAGEIISRNLLWPLRKELLPLLQKLLIWVKNNRTMFVQWGQVLANIFRAIVTIAKTVINSLKPIYDAFMKIIKDIFGNTVKNMSDVLNILLFRLTVLVLYIHEVFRPVITLFTKFIGIIWELQKAFVEGLGDSFGDTLGSWSEVIGGLVQSFHDLINAILGLEDKSENVKGFLDFMKSLFFTTGKIMGGFVKVIFLALKEIMDIITYIITGDVSKMPKIFRIITDAINSVITSLKGFVRNVRVFFTPVIKFIQMAINQVKSFLAQIKKIYLEIERFITKYYDKVNKKIKSFVPSFLTGDEKKKNDLKGKQAMVDIPVAPAGMDRIRSAISAPKSVKYEINMNGMNIQANTKEDAKAIGETLKEETTNQIFKEFRRSINLDKMIDDNLTTVG